MWIWTIRTDLVNVKVINHFKYLTQIIHVSMRFLDVHPMEGLDESLLKELQNAPADEFGCRDHFEEIRFFPLTSKSNSKNLNTTLLSNIVGYG